MKISEKAKGAWTVILYVFLIAGWLAPCIVLTQCQRSIEKQIAKYEYKIKIARRDKRIERFEHQIEVKEWYLEKAEWKKEWNDRYPD